MLVFHAEIADAAAAIAREVMGGIPTVFGYGLFRLLSSRLSIWLADVVLSVTPLVEVSMASRSLRVKSPVLSLLAYSLLMPNFA